jgi:predicted DNA-binding transcriptional regulator AlpA
MHILTTSDVTRLTGLSRTTLWRLERQGKFPTRIRLGLNSVGWRDEEVQHWVEGDNLDAIVPRVRVPPGQPTKGYAATGKLLCSPKRTRLQGATPQCHRRNRKY